MSITENDMVGVTIDPTELTVVEGDATGVNYTVVLTSEPAGDVKVRVSGHSGTDLTLTGPDADGDLTFTTANWGTAQTVTVKAAEDDDGVTDADVTLDHAISSTDDTDYDALANQSVTVSITENDMVGVTIDPTELTVVEGDATGVNYTVVLTSEPAGDVKVRVSGHSGTDLTLTGPDADGDLTFTTANWGTAQTVTVKAAEDDDGVTDADVTLDHAISSTDDTDYDALADQSVTVSITENDMVGVTIDPTELTVVEGDATGVNYTVVLTSEPAGDVKVRVSGHSGTDLTLTGPDADGDLTFTTANWGTAQTVTVKAAEDDDGVTDADVTLDHAISSTDDTDYDALANQSVTVSITENDADGVTISPTSLTVTEGDATGVNYTVVLTSEPAGDVKVRVSGHSGTDLTLTGPDADGDLTFTTANWGTAQTVTVKAAEDDDGVTDADVTLDHAISSTDDTDYDALANQSVTVSITENDADGVTISPTSLTVTEGDATGVNYTVVLTSEPAGDVKVRVSGHSGTDLTLTGPDADGDLTFTTANWGTAQTVTVKAAEDDDGVTDADVTLDHAISSTDDSTYDALADQSVTVSITENDMVGVTIDPTELTVVEGDATGVNYTVVLTSEPAGDVKVRVSGHSGTDLTLTGPDADGDLTFTTANWGTAQTVTVKAAEDDDGVTDADVTLDHAISSTDDTDYDALANQSVTVSITENDMVGVTIDPTELTVVEGDATGVNYTVVLTSEPAGDVKVRVSGHSGTDLTLTGPDADGDLTFTTANWGTAQTVTVKAAEDDDGVTDADVTLDHAISSTDDTDYDALANQSVTVSITENDMVGVTIDPTELTVVEGDATGVNYTVVLTSEPAGDVKVRVSGHSGTDLTLTGPDADGDLTFTTANWGTAQTVTVKAAEDDDGVTDADVTLDHAISSTDDTDYDALANQSVTVSITENDMVGVTIDPTELTVVEGDATGASYNVKLTSQPAGDVTVTVSGHSGTDLTLSGTGLSNDALTFTTTNWGTAQTVTVKAAEDADAVPDADVTLVHAISSTDDSTYDALADQSVTVSITENDAVTVVEKEIHYTIEGASGVAGVEVLLSAPLQSEVTIPITVLSQSTAAPEDYVVTDSAGYASDPGLTFSPGETFGYIFIKAVLDTIDEQTETVVLGFGTLPAGVSEGSPSGSTVEIKDAIQVSFANSSYMVEEGGTGVEVVVKLNKPRKNLRVPLTATGHGGADASDFAGVPQEVVFEDDETEATFIFMAIEDSEEEYGEMVRLGFGAFSEGIVAILPDSAMVMIADVDDHCPPTLESAVVDGRTVTLTFTAPMALVEPPSDPDHPDYEERPNPPEHFFTLFEGWPEPTDSNIGSDSYRVNYGTLARTFSLDGPVVTLTFPDTIRTDSKVWVRYDKFSRYAPLGPSTSEGCNDRRGVASFITELDDSDNTGGTTPLPALTITGGEGRERFDEDIAFTVTLTPASTELVTVDYRTVARTATEGEDFTPTSGTLEFAPDDTEKTVRVPIIDDNVEDDGETFLLDLFDASGATMVDTESWATGTIRNSEEEGEPPPANTLTASFANVPAEHGGGEEDNRFTFDLAFSENTTARYAMLRDHAFTITGGNVVRAKRRTKGSNQHWHITVEPDGWGDIALSLPGGRTCGTTGAICTADNRQISNSPSATVQGPAALSVADANAREGSDATLDFAVSLDRASTLTVTVDYATSDGTATAGDDYTATSGTLTFAPGDVAKTVSVPILDDLHDDDGETLTLALSNASNARIADGTATGTIENSDPIPKAWLARFGRTVATHVTDAVGERLRGSPGQDSHLTVGGYRVPLNRGESGAARPGPDEPAAKADSAPAEAGVDGAAGRTTTVLEGVARVLGLGAGATGDRAGPVSRAGWDPWLDGPAGDPRLGRSQTMPALRLRDVLLGSSFRLSLGADDSDSSHPRLTAWGRVATTRFDGRDGTLSLDGDVLTGTVGVDGTWDRWLAGIAVAHSRGDGSFTDATPNMEDRGQGDLEQTLTSIHPYLRYAVTDELDVWGLLGYGWGELTLAQPGAASLETDTDFVMGAFGGRGILLAAPESGGFQLATRTDAMLTRITSEAVTGLASSAADAHRLRLILEGSRGFTWAEGRSLTPTMEVGLRHDWGDAETGFGVELGGRVQYADPALGLTIEGAVRGLLAHEDRDYQEWGASGSLRLDPGAAGRGLSLTLAPTWGAAQSGVDGLWSRQTTAGLAPSGRTPAQAGRLTAQVGYGLWLPSTGGLVTPFTGVSVTDGDGWRTRAGLLFVRPDTWGGGLRLELAGESSTTAVGQSAQTIGLQLQFTFGRGRRAAPETPGRGGTVRATPVRARTAPDGVGPGSRIPTPRPPVTTGPHATAKPPGLARDRADGPRYFVQLGLFSNHADALRAKTDLAGDLRDLLHHRRLAVVRSTGTGRARVVYVQPFPTPDAAAVLCAAIQTHGPACAVTAAWPGPGRDPHERRVAAAHGGR